MKNNRFYLIIVSIFFIVLVTYATEKVNNKEKDAIKTSKPYARYWWFASEIQKKDVRYNLDWLKDHGFGGVEMAFVYPLNAFNAADSTYIPRQEWLGEDWKDIVKYTIVYSDSIGLACDITFGTLWPFGDSKVTFEQGVQRFGDKGWRQMITKSWEYPETAYVIDHLTPDNYLPYFNRLIKAFPHPEINLPQSYFIDSWEVETEKLWCEGFKKDFIKQFNYDIVPFMDSIYEIGFEHYLYDYMSLISDKVLKFYNDFDSVLNANDIISRGQVSGAPCDLISGYSRLDIPEGEAMLYQPEFSSIPASAAFLSGKNIVSSETFTCLYGWPGDYIRKEQTADLKLVADALYANGINHIIWHGKPHNSAGSDSVNFYASVHLGDSGMLARNIKEFNQYLEKLSSWMRKGNTYSDVAVYLPTEDAWIAGYMPKELQFKWAWGYYEMRYNTFSSELKPYSPTWINGEFLEKSRVENDILKVGNANYKALYVDAKYVEYNVVKQLLKLSKEGFPIILKQKPSEPGINKHKDYNDLVLEILDHENVYSSVPKDFNSLISGEFIPPYWCRKEGKDLIIFFANPDSEGLKFPVEYGQSYNNKTKSINIEVNYEGDIFPLKLEFKPYQSLLYRIGNSIEKIDISFVPEEPDVKERPKDYKAPWLVE